MLQVSSLCVPSGTIFVLGAGSAIFGLLRRFPIEWCKSRLCRPHLMRIWAKIRFRGWECDFRTPEAIPDRSVQVSSLYASSRAILDRNTFFGCPKMRFGVQKRVLDAPNSFSVSKNAFLASKNAFLASKNVFWAPKTCFPYRKTRFGRQKTRIGQVTWRYMSNSEIFVSEAGSAIFGFLAQFPID